MLTNFLPYKETVDCLDQNWWWFEQQVGYKLKLTYIYRLYLGFRHFVIKVRPYEHNDHSRGMFGYSLKRYQWGTQLQ